MARARCHEGTELTAELQRDLIHALGGDVSLIAFPWQRKYRSVVDKRCNLALPTPRPAAITFPKHVRQIREIVKTAARHGLAIQARSGGHSYGNHSLGGGGPSDTIIIDLRHFQYVHVCRSENEGSHSARVGASTRLGHITRELNAYGVAIPHGTCPSVGIGGHATIGGLGPTSRMWGLSLDHIIEMTVVLADGEVVVTSASSRPDLFFALRGAAASFGIVVEFMFKTRPAPKSAVQFSCMITANQYADMAEHFEEWQSLVSAPGLTRKLFSQVIITMRGMRITGTYFGSEHELHDEPFAKHFLYSSLIKTAHHSKIPQIASAEEGGGSFFHHLLPRKGIFKCPLERRSRVKMAVTIRKLNWVCLINEWAGGRLLSKILGRSSAFHSRSCTISTGQRIAPAAIKKLFLHLDTAKKGTPLWFLIFDLAGGAVNDIATEKTAFAHRNVGVYCQSYAIALFGKLHSSCIQFVDGINEIVKNGIHDDVDRAQHDAVYPGYVDADLESGQQLYWRENLPRLQDLKAIYDPANTFRNPQSIRPAAVRSDSKVASEASSLVV